MEQILIPEIETELDRRADDERVHHWRIEQLRGLGLSRRVAERFADLVDWHELADLVARGCSPDLALEIVR